MADGGWRDQIDELRQEHRDDLLHVLAYANLVNTSDVVCCLVYPCSLPTWESLVRRNRLFHQAELPNRGRRIRVWLTAMPMCGAAERVLGGHRKAGHMGSLQNRP
jgi:hypothetical protein